MSTQYYDSIPSFSTLDKPFKICIEAINSIPENSKLDLQIGLYHGGRPLCPLKTVPIKSNGEVHAEVEFDITLSNIPRMAKLCFGLFEKRKNTQQPCSWVNCTVFDYKVIDSLSFRGSKLIYRT